MKIVAFGASTSSTSINKTLATYAAQQVEGAKVSVLDLNNYNVPMFSEDKEKEIGQAEGAIAFLRELEQAGCHRCIICRAQRFLCSGLQKLVRLGNAYRAQCVPK